MSHNGIFGYNGSTSQFSIHTEDGKAYFSGERVKMDDAGMTVGNTNVGGTGAGSVIFKYDNSGIF